MGRSIIKTYFFHLLDQAYGNMSMVLVDDGGDVPFEDEHHEHYETISNGIFDWEALDEVYGFMDFGHDETW